MDGGNQMPRKVKDGGFGFEAKGHDDDKEHWIHMEWRNRLKRYLICWIIGHDEVGVYSWISYCQRCSLAFEPSDKDEDQ